MSTNSDSKVAPEILAEAYAWIEEIIDRLNDLSRSIRKSGKVQSDGKATILSREMKVAEICGRTSRIMLVS